MKWTEVKSSAISALGYETGRRRLGIEFRESRLVYFYYAVPRWEYESFLKADSKGHYLTQVFLPKGYSCSGPHPRRTRAA